jgi:hypothetical protein
VGWCTSAIVERSGALTKALLHSMGIKIPRMLDYAYL